MSTTSKHPPVSVTETKIRSTYKTHMAEKWKKCARGGIATHVTVHRRETTGTTKRKVIESSASPFCRQRAKDMAGSAREDAEPRKSRQRGRKTGLHGFYYTSVFHGNDTVQYAGLRETNLMTQEMLSHKAINWKLNELEN